MISYTKTWTLSGDKLTIGMLSDFMHEMGDDVPADTIVQVSGYDDQRDGRHFSLTASVTSAGGTA